MGLLTVFLTLLKGQLWAHFPHSSRPPFTIVISSSTLLAQRFFIFFCVVDLLAVQWSFWIYSQKNVFECVKYIRLQRKPITLKCLCYPLRLLEHNARVVCGAKSSLSGRRKNHSWLPKGKLPGIPGRLFRAEWLCQLWGDSKSTPVLLWAKKVALGAQASRFEAGNCWGIPVCS